MIHVVEGEARVAAAANDLVVRVDAPAPAAGEAAIVLAIADPALATALRAAIATALRGAVVPPVAAELAIVSVAGAVDLVACIEAARATGAAGIQLVWDGGDRDAIEPRVFAALEHARATPEAAPVVLARVATPVAALEILVAARRPPA